MNAQVLEETSVAPTLCVTTLKDPMPVVVLVVTKVMEETAQVIFIFTHLFHYCATAFSCSVLEAQLFTRALEH